MRHSELRDVLVAQKFLVDQRQEDEARVMGLLGYEPKLGPSLEPPASVVAARPSDPATGLVVAELAIPESEAPPRFTGRWWLRLRAWIRRQRRALLALGGSVAVVVGVVIAARLVGWIQVIAFSVAVVLVALIVRAVLWMRNRVDGAAGIDGGQLVTEGDGEAAGGEAGSRIPAGVLQEKGGTRRPEPTPIIDFRRRRGVGAGLVSVLAPSKAIDLNRLVEQLAQGRPLTQLPTLDAFSVQPDFTVLIDRGPSMTPFLSDLLVLERSLHSQFPGPGRVFYSFVDHPSFGVGHTRLKLKPLTAAMLSRPPGRVLVVSDLGIGSARHDLTADWAQFDGWLHSLGLSPCYLIPYSRHRLSEPLGDLPVVEWRSGLNVRTIRRELQRA